jgi:threonine-phosphate decarboxylase
VKAIHGGDVRALAARAGRDPDALLDFSANVNPLGPPDGVRAALRRIADDPTELTRYPDPTSSEVRAAFGASHGIDSDRIVVGNGSAALVGAVVRALAPARCVLPVPAFSEYRKALRDAAVDAIEVPSTRGGYEPDIGALVRAAREAGAGLCMLSNPNNPTGALASREGIVELERALRAEHCRLVVDEAFIDYAPHASCIPFAPEAIVLRSLTKFYAIPGVRIGYAIAPASLARAIAGALPSWPVGAIEARAALAALDDRTYATRTRETNAHERERMREGLVHLGFRVLPSAANFLFVDVGPAGMTARRLADDLLERDGIAVRVCDDFSGLPSPTFVRVAVKAPADNERLLGALRARSPHAEGSPAR